MKNYVWTSYMINKSREEYYLSIKIDYENPEARCGEIRRLDCDTSTNAKTIEGIVPAIVSKLEKMLGNGKINFLSITPSNVPHFSQDKDKISEAANDLSIVLLRLRELVASERLESYDLVGIERMEK